MTVQNSNGKKAVIGKILDGLGFLLFLFIVYYTVFFVTASFTATSNGPILWNEGWDTLVEELKGFLAL